MHLKKLSSKFKKSLFKQMYEEHPEYLEKKKKRRERSRSQNKNKPDKKSKKKKRENETDSSTRNSEERQMMINEWNETGIMNVN